MRTKILFILILVSITVSPSFGQKDNRKITITGTVVDAYQAPVRGAEIIIDGLKYGNPTDKNGIYKIKVKSSAKKIGIFTLPPAIIQEPINGRTTINFTLNDSIVKQIYRERDAYGEEMVNVGYGTQKRKNLTTSVSKIDGTRARYDSYNSIYEMIRGEVPGVQVNGTSIRIREASSIVADLEPLYVVDGVPVITLDGIQPQLVKSIEVLKGSAASIYGSRGSNGVIIITLLSGSRTSK
jgi:TonB-dependent SusC/RagA subfamily outer membrane receptor